MKQELTERAPIGTASVAGNASGVLEPRTRIGFVSLGCPKNLVDSEVMMGLLDQAGAEITNHPETADILVVNTCSFIDKAKQESIDTILQMAEHKVSGKARKLIVAGCLVERYRDEIRKNMPEVDAVVGTGELEAILAAAGLEAPAPPPDQPQLFSILRSDNGQKVASRAEGDLRESQGRFARETLGRRAAETSPISLRPHHAALAGDAQIVGVHQDRGRLRPSLQLLRHPQSSRQVSLPALCLRGRRGRAVGRPGRTRTHPDWPGHDLLRRRLGA